MINQLTSHITITIKSQIASIKRNQSNRNRVRFPMLEEAHYRFAHRVIKTHGHRGVHQVYLETSILMSHHCP